MSYNADLTVFVPTRGRPKVPRQFFGDFAATVTANSLVVFVLDEDDPELAKYKANIPLEAGYLVAPPTERGMVGALNFAFAQFLVKGLLGRAVGFMGDDHRTRTRGWDTRYLEELRQMGSGFVYGNDLFQYDNIPTQVAMTTDIPIILGWMAHPKLKHLWVDTMWKTLGEGMGRIKYLDDVIVEHMHPLAGKARYDRNYRIVNNMILAKHDQAVYYDWFENERPQDVEKLRGLLR